MTDEATAVLDPPAATDAELASYVESDWGRMSETDATRRLPQRVRNLPKRTSLR